MRPRRSHTRRTSRPGRRPQAAQAPPARPAGRVFNFTPTAMTQAMVDRLFWRAGFGPTATDRAAWIGKPLTDAVDYAALLAARPRSPGPTRRTTASRSIRTATTPTWCSAWVDRMVRTHNPLRRAHDVLLAPPLRELARRSVSPPQLLPTQNDLLPQLRATSPPTRTVDFRDLALDVSTDPSMLRYLTGESNVAGGAQRELRARAHGALHARRERRRPAQELQRERRRSSSRRRSRAGTSTTATRTTREALYDRDAGTTARSPLFGKLGNWRTPDASSTLVLAQAGHATYLVASSGASSSPTPPRRATLSISRRPTRRTAADQAAAAGDPDPPAALRLDRRAEHDQAPRRLRGRGACARSASAITRLDGRRLPRRDGPAPYFPPNVSGWEGGLSWLNTNTALARCGFVAQLIATRRTARRSRRRRRRDAAGRLRPRVRRRGLALARPGTRDPILARRARLGQAHPAPAAPARSLRTLMLAGPDAQVM